MSAVMKSTAPARFSASKEMPRDLLLDMDDGRLFIGVRAPNGRVSLAAACITISDVTLHRGAMQSYLGCGGPIFYVTHDEAEEIERVFAPMGLRVTR